MTFTQLMANHPNVIAYVAGHTHEHALLPCGSTRTTGPGNRRFCGNHLWWEINTSAVADWPHQHRLIEVMDNRDDTLSIFGTVLDHASPATAPAAGNASSFIARQLATIGRTFGFNDPQSGPPRGEGDPQLDQNVEMLVDDPRQANLRITKLDNPDPVRIGSTLTYTLQVENLGPFARDRRERQGPPPEQLALRLGEDHDRILLGVRRHRELQRWAIWPPARSSGSRSGCRVQGTPRTITNAATVSAITDDPDR